MILAIDIGNTNIVIGGFENDSISFTARVATDVLRTEEQYAVEIHQILHLYGYSAKEMDMGTATTMSVINEKEEFIGGAIMPGLRLSLEALSSKASLLPHIDLIPPKSVIGRNTVDAMDSGIIYGAASMLDGMIDRIQQELGQPVQVVATGGLSKKVTPYCRHSIIQDPNLLLKGLRILYYKNVK